MTDSPHLTEIPSSALASAAAVIGRTGSGKTFAAKSAIERDLAAGARVRIIDPTGAWWGLRARPDGSPSALAPVIFGGDHAGIKASGGHFNAGRKDLRDGGLVIEEGDLVRIATPSGDVPAPSSDPAALIETWSRVLSGAAPKLLGALFAAGGSASRIALAEDLGVKPSGGHWNAGWKKLRDNGIVTAEGDVARLTELFRPGG